jgi:hypothetical protein
MLKLWNSSQEFAESTTSGEARIPWQQNAEIRLRANEKPSGNGKILRWQEKWIF